MKEKIIKYISEKLENKSIILADQGHCTWLWGETELPDEIREEASKKRNNAKS